VGPPLHARRSTLEGFPYTMSLSGTVSDESLDQVRRAIELERRAGRRAAPVEIGEVRCVDEARHVWAVDVHASDPLPEGLDWAGATLARRLGDPGVPEDLESPFEAQILDVDGLHSRLYVTAHPDSPPSPGPARVHPFDFLRAPYTLVTSPRFAGARIELARRLAAARGHATADRVHARRALNAWNSGWGVVWGPPGTGKTWTLAQRVAELLRDPHERVLVLSTTNKAADQAALELGRACRTLGVRLDGVWRAGRSRDPHAFDQADLSALLPPATRELMPAMSRAERAVSLARGPARAMARHQVSDLQRRMPTLHLLAQDPRLRAGIATLHAGLRLVVSDAMVEWLAEGRAPFTTVVLDEAGLVGRAQAAAASLLAARRFMLIGDPRQLSPIARATRSMPPQVMRWVARSALHHLQVDQPLDHVQRLTRQRRMHPDICRGISALQYQGLLGDHESVIDRTWPGSGTLQSWPRLLWIPLDRLPGLSGADVTSARAEGGSRARPGTLTALEQLLQVGPELAQQQVLFISPYRAQARAVRAWAQERGLDWSASTVHAQQGAQADVVVFDTVHASSTAWSAAEWARLVNVGLSRARQLAVLIASEREASQPWMAPLRAHLAACIPSGGKLLPVKTRPDQAELFGAQLHISAASPDLDAPPPPRGTRLGDQIARRRRLRSVLSREQRILVERTLADAGPRLVRGVAGSGKTLVLARWAARALRGAKVEHLLVVFANAALRPLLDRMLREAWADESETSTAFPEERVQLLHVGQLLADLRLEVGLPEPTGEARWDYDAQAAAILERGPPEARFPLILVDEAQDLGHHALALLVGLAEPYKGNRPVMVFYDNAQNIYGRSRPNWKALGLDMRGRSYVMRESFRTTQPILELALNLCHRLRPLEHDPDVREQIREGLLERDETGWWRARYCEVHGELPHIGLYDTPEHEERAVVQQVQDWIRQQAVRPGDIRLVCFRRTRGERLAQLLSQADVPARFAASTRFEDDPHRVVVTTTHSMKGYDAEVVVVVGVDRFATRGRILVETLYVALTRARTVLHVTGTRHGEPALVTALQELRTRA